MSKKRGQRDPAAAFVRDAIAARSVGDRKCSCGEQRAWALIRQSEPPQCYECRKKKRRITTRENHHIAGEANDPTTIGVPANDHVAELTRAQYEWPKKTLKNPEGSPLLARAASIRGLVDTKNYLTKKLRLSDPEFYEKLDEFLTEKFGPKWWKNSGLEKFAPDW